jgi:hypothetical protein
MVRKTLELLCAAQGASGDSLKAKRSGQKLCSRRIFLSGSTISAYWKTMQPTLNLPSAPKDVNCFTDHDQSHYYWKG